ncbi:Cuticle protein [Amphibalanus amphitrite]|uniref:Cuticle protein n=1 Tax=Amphibalanus amphitrite TaxID=1232801 RepID=A0A6A4WQ28_AMPAM|nr:Cuticle protein [Amphibalanus amphitrite]
MKLFLLSALLAAAAAQYGPAQYGPAYYGPAQYGPAQYAPYTPYGGGIPQAHPPRRDYHSVPDYSYGYGVSDPVSGVHNTKEETRLGDRTEGSYSTLLPDGRRQIVTYWVDGNSGYNAKVTYEGVAQHPPAKPVVHTPAVPSYGGLGPGQVY